MAKPNTLDKNKADVAQIFLVWMATVGSNEQTALALDLEPEQVRRLAESEGWNEKIRRVSLMSKNGKPGDYERMVNRCLNFVQAQVLRTQVNRLLTEVTAMSNEELLSRACVRTRDGGMQLSAKFFVDLANAAEAAQRMSYAALSDTAGERAERDSGGTGGQGANDLHAAIIAALSNPGLNPESVSQKLLAEANEEVQARASAKALVEPLVSPQSPADSADQ